MKNTYGEDITPIPPLPPATGSVVALPNDTKIRFCNALMALRHHAHAGNCHECATYLQWGDSDLCAKGKDIIAMEMAYADTSIEFPPNNVRSDAPSIR